MENTTDGTGLEALITKAATDVAGLATMAEKATTDAAAAEQALHESLATKARIAEALTTSTESAELLRQRADDAKAVGTELTSLIAQVQARAQQANETMGQANAALEAARTLASAASESAARIEGLKTKIEQEAQVAEQRSKHIEDGRKYVDEKRAEIDIVANGAQQAASAAEAQQQASRKVVEDLGAIFAATQTQKGTIDGLAEELQRVLKQCEGHAVTTKGLATVAQEVGERVAGYESKLQELEKRANERLKTIDGLLPGAASTGLASAFGKRREHFKWPMRIWQGAFMFSLIALIVIAWIEFGLLTKPDATLSWDHLALMLVHRLPFMAPLIWLAYYASTKAALAQRVEEDYAFKETVSRSFEGYRREMSDLEGKTTPQSALDKLCGGVLGVVTSPPGRIYEKHPLVQSPFSKSETPPTEEAKKDGKK